LVLKIIFNKISYLKDLAHEESLEIERDEFVFGSELLTLFFELLSMLTVRVVSPSTSSSPEERIEQIAKPNMSSSTQTFR
jgi:hypothetical protein